MEQDFQKRIEKHQKFLLKLLNLHIFGYYPLRRYLGISIGNKKIDEISHLSWAYDTKYFKKGKKWYKQQTRTYQQPDLAWKLNLVLDKIPQLGFSIPALLQPAYGLGALAFFFLTQTTYQPTTKDNFIGNVNIATTNKGDADNVQIVSRTSRDYYYNALFHFDISDLPSNPIISEAILGLYHCSHPQGDDYTTARTVYINRLTRTNWTELGSIWEKYDGTNNWTTPGGDYTTDDGASTVVPTTKNQWVNWDITDIVEYSVENVSKQVHLLGRRYDDASFNNDACVFWSKDYTTDTTLRPKLTVTYTAPVDNAILFSCNF